MSESTCNSSFFLDPKPLLSGRDMLQHHVGNYDFNTRIRLVKAEEESEQQEDISRIKNEFRTVLAQQRVGKAEMYSEGEWDNKRKRIRIRKAVGKWHIYGYLENKVQYVDGYEALHLLEMNRLIVFWDTVLISLEQAYTLFLGYPESLSLEHYKVYSTMMRAGFCLLKFDLNRKYQIDTETTEQNLDEERACVWRNLYKILRQHNPISQQEQDTDQALAQQVERSMQNFNSMIASQIESSNEIKSSDDNTQDDDQEIPFKRQRIDSSAIETKTANQSKLDAFADLFESFEIVHSTLETDLDPDEKSSNVQLHFDMFCNSDGSTFRKSQPSVPEYRIIIRLSSEPPLTANDIAALYSRQPKPDVPILLMLVAETLSIHCFLYSFYRLPKNLVVIPPRRIMDRNSTDDDDLAIDDNSSDDD